MIKAIIFDCFGVLTTDQWRAFVDSLPPDIDTAKARELNRQYDAGLLTAHEFIDQVAALTDQSPEKVAALLDNEANKNAMLLGYIGQLRNHGYRIGMISNVGTDWITKTFLTAEEQALFDDMIFSYEVGMTKPDPRIFHMACERLAVPPEEAVFVDDIASYCTSAEQEGLQTIVYEDFRQFKSALLQILSHD